jgi:hypothetical protein
MTRFSINPAEENFRLWEQERKHRRDAYWLKLRKARADYFNETVETEHPDLGGFRYWMERKWGLSIEIIDGNLGAEYVIKDQNKFLLFQMKYA